MYFQYSLLISWHAQTTDQEFYSTQTNVITDPYSGITYTTGGSGEQQACRKIGGIPVTNRQTCHEIYKKFKGDQLGVGTIEKWQDSYKNWGSSLGCVASEEYVFWATDTDNPKGAACDTSYPCICMIPDIYDLRATGVGIHPSEQAACEAVGGLPITKEEDCHKAYLKRQTSSTTTTPSM